MRERPIWFSAPMVLALLDDMWHDRKHGERLGRAALSAIDKVQP